MGRQMTDVEAQRVDDTRRYRGSRGFIERRAYTENMAAQEAVYWFCRGYGIKVDDHDIGQILQVAGPIILRDAAEKGAALDD